MRMRILQVVLAGLFVSGVADAEPLTGTVTDKDDGSPIADALVRAGGQRTKTDSKGSFAIDVKLPVVLKVSVPGYSSFSKRIAKAAPIDVKLRLLQEGVELVEIVGEYEEDAAPKKYRIGREQLKFIPGTGGDPLIAIQNTPGAARIPVGLGGLVLRGSAPRDTAVMIDFVRVPLLYHFGGIRSFYQADLLDSVEVTASGFSSRFGRAQGGLVEIVSYGGDPEKWNVGAQISLLDSSAVVSGPMLGGQWSFGARRSYLDLVLRPFVEDDVALPIYSDAQIRYQREKGKYTHVVNLFGSLDTSESDFAALNNNFARLLHNMTYKDDQFTLRRTLYVGWDQVSIQDKEPGEEEEVLQHDSIAFGGRLELERTYSSGRVLGGIDIEAKQFSYNFGNFDDDTVAGLSKGEVFDANVGAYAVNTIRLLDNSLVLEPSLRFDYFAISDELTVDPRITVREQISPSVALKQSFGRYSQPPRPVDIAHATSNPALDSSHSWQTAFGIEYTGLSWLELSVTGFHASLRQLPTYAVQPGGFSTTPPRIIGPAAPFFELINSQFGYFGYQENIGSGRSYGAEVFARVARKNWFGWVAYTYARSFRTDDPSRFPDERKYPFDQPHNLTVVASYELGNWRFGTRARLISGSPYTPVVGRLWDVDSSRWRRINGDPFAARLPYFFSLDVRVDYTWKRSWGNMSLFLDLRNATNRGNAEGVVYRNDYRQRTFVNGIPIFPSIGLEYRR